MISTHTQKMEMFEDFIEEVKVNRGILSDEFVGKLYVSKFITYSSHKDFGNLFKSSVVPYLSDEELFNVTRSIIRKHNQYDEGHILRSQGRLSSDLYKECARRFHYSPGQHALCPPMDVLNWEVYQVTKNHPETKHQPKRIAAIAIAFKLQGLNQLQIDQEDTILFHAHVDSIQPPPMNGFKFQHSGWEKDIRLNTMQAEIRHVYEPQRQLPKRNPPAIKKQPNVSTQPNVKKQPNMSIQPTISMQPNASKPTNISIQPHKMHNMSSPSLVNTSNQEKNLKDEIGLALKELNEECLDYHTYLLSKLNLELSKAKRELKSGENANKVDLAIDMINILKKKPNHDEFVKNLPVIKAYVPVAFIEENGKVPKIFKKAEEVSYLISILDNPQTNLHEKAHQFASAYQASEIAKNPETLENKKFNQKVKRNVFSLGTLGVYAFARGLQVSSVTFWNNRRDIFNRRVVENPIIKTPGLTK